MKRWRIWRTNAHSAPSTILIAVMFFNIQLGLVFSNAASAATTVYRYTSIFGFDVVTGSTEHRALELFFRNPTPDAFRNLPRHIQLEMYVAGEKQRGAPEVNLDGVKIPEKNLSTYTLNGLKYGSLAASTLTPEEQLESDISVLKTLIHLGHANPESIRTIAQRIRGSALSKADPNVMQRLTCDVTILARASADIMSPKGQFDENAGFGFTGDKEGEKTWLAKISDQKHQSAIASVENIEKNFGSYLSGTQGNFVCNADYYSQDYQGMRPGEMFAQMKARLKALGSFPNAPSVARTANPTPILAENPDFHSVCTKSQLKNAFSDVRSSLLRFPYATHGMSYKEGTCRIVGSIWKVKNGSVYMRMHPHVAGARFKNQSGKDLDEMVENLFQWQQEVVIASEPANPTSPVSGPRTSTSAKSPVAR